METPSFIKVENNSFIFKDDGIFKLYVPEKYFDIKMAEFVGEIVNVFGILTYEICDKNDKIIHKMDNFKFPAKFNTKPDDIEIVKDFKIFPTSEPQRYRVLKYYKNGVVVVNYAISETVDNLNTFYSALQYGNLPNCVPYNEWQDYFFENIALTGNSYKVSAQLMGIVFSELCRSSKDPSVPFRMSKSKDMRDYKMCNIREIPREISPFTAITSENWDEALISSTLADSNKQHSPMEKIMMD